MPDLLLPAMTCGALVVGAFVGWQLARRTLSGENRRLKAALQSALDEARRDPLTGLWNRRAFDEQLAMQVAIARRYGVPCAVILLDVDELKSINDRHGHAAGDEALKRLAGVLRESSRAADFAARIGGDEFALLLPQTDAAGARAAAERITRRINAPPTGSVPAASVSVGVAALAPDESPAGLLQRADEALYGAKK